MHNNVTFNTNKNIFITNDGDTVKVKIPIFLQDISDCFRQLDFPHEFGEYDISLQIVDEIYYKDTEMAITSQTIKSAYLYTDICYLDEKNNIDYVKNLNKFSKTIPIFDNHVKVNNDKIQGSDFTINVNNVSNCKNMYLMFIKDDSIVKIPNKSCSNIQLKINSENFKTQFKIILMHLLFLKTDHLIIMNFY